MTRAQLVAALSEIMYRVRFRRPMGVADGLIFASSRERAEAAALRWCQRQGPAVRFISVTPEVLTTDAILDAELPPEPTEPLVEKPSHEEQTDRHRTQAAKGATARLGG